MMIEISFPVVWVTMSLELNEIWSKLLCEFLLPYLLSSNPEVDDLEQYLVSCHFMLNYVIFETHYMNLNEGRSHCQQEICCAGILVSGDMVFVCIFAGYWNRDFRKHYDG